MTASWSASRGSLTGAPARILSIDPGITTGWAYFVNGELTDYGQAVTPVVSKVIPALSKYPFDVLVVEGYKIYASKIAEHVGSSVYTVQLIGAIEMWRVLNAPRSVTAIQYAAQAKGFVDDDKLRAWAMYARGLRHARDAIRHGCYYIVFGGWRRGKGAASAKRKVPLTAEQARATMGPRRNHRLPK